MSTAPRAAQRAQARAEAVLAEVERQLVAGAGPAPTPVDAPPPPPHEAATPPAPEPQPAPPPRAPDEWEQRYRSLQGRWNAEIPRMEESIKDLKRQLDAALEEARKVSKTPEPPRVESAKDIEDFGSDLVGMVARVAEAALRSASADYENRLSKLEQTLAGTTQAVAQTAEQAFFAELSRLVPDWEQVNTQQPFLDWLAEADPVYNVQRQVALNNASKAMDAKRCAAIFTTWKSLSEPKPIPKPAPSLAQQQVPSASAGSSPPAPEAPEIFTEADVARFYNDQARGKWRGREKERAQIEARINKALVEGRVRPTRAT